MTSSHVTCIYYTLHCNVKMTLTIDPYSPFYKLLSSIINCRAILGAQIFGIFSKLHVVLTNKCNAKMTIKHVLSDAYTIAGPFRLGFEYLPLRSADDNA